MEGVGLWGGDGVLFGEEGFVVGFDFLVFDEVFD